VLGRRPADVSGERVRQAPCDRDRRPGRLCLQLLGRVTGLAAAASYDFRVSVVKTAGARHGLFAYGFGGTTAAFDNFSHTS
jgi:hypothetical protein